MPQPATMDLDDAVEKELLNDFNMITQDPEGEMVGLDLPELTDEDLEYLSKAFPEPVGVLQPSAEDENVPLTDKESGIQKILEFIEIGFPVETTAAKFPVPTSLVPKLSIPVQSNGVPSILNQGTPSLNITFDLGKKTAEEKDKLKDDSKSVKESMSCASDNERAESLKQIVDINMSPGSATSIPELITLDDDDSDGDGADDIEILAEMPRTLSQAKPKTTDEQHSSNKNGRRRREQSESRKAPRLQHLATREQETKNSVPAKKKKIAEALSVSPPKDKPTPAKAAADRWKTRPASHHRMHLRKRKMGSA